jgi:hypothetical protein
MNTFEHICIHVAADVNGAKFVTFLYLDPDVFTSLFPPEFHDVPIFQAWKNADRESAAKLWEAANPTLNTPKTTLRPGQAFGMLTVGSTAHRFPILCVRDASLRFGPTRKEPEAGTTAAR